MKETVKQEGIYQLVDNCRPMYTEKGSALMVRGGSITDSFGDNYEYDKRLNMVVINATNDVNMFLRYLQLYIGMLNDRTSNPEYKSTIVEHLDMGFIPVFIAPTFMIDNKDPLVQQIGSLIRGLTLNGEPAKCLTTIPMNFDSCLVGKTQEDIWLNRLQVAKHFNRSVDDICIEEIISLAIAQAEGV